MPKRRARALTPHKNFTDLKPNGGRARRDLETAKLQNYKITKITKYKITKLRKLRNTKLRNCEITKLQTTKTPDPIS